MKRIVEKYDAIVPGTTVFMRYARGELAVVADHKDADSGLWMTIAQTKRLGRHWRLLDRDRYLCSLKHDQAFLAWWEEKGKEAHSGGSTFDAAAAAWEAARTPVTTEQALAVAVLVNKDQAALLALPDCLIEMGRLPMNISPSGEATLLRRALERVIDRCRDAGCGLDDTYEFRKARVLIGELAEEERG
jgi:hypothetical protein